MEQANNDIISQIKASISGEVKQETITKRTAALEVIKELQNTLKMGYTGLAGILLTYGLQVINAWAGIVAALFAVGSIAIFIGKAMKYKKFLQNKYKIGDNEK